MGVAQNFVYATPTNFSLAHLFMICIRNNLNYWRNSTILILRWKIRCLIGIILGKKHTYIMLIWIFAFPVLQAFTSTYREQTRRKEGWNMPSVRRGKVFSEKLLIFVKSNLFTAVKSSKRQLKMYWRQNWQNLIL